MANAETTKTAEGGPYRRHHVVFEHAGRRGFRGVDDGADEQPG